MTNYTRLISFLKDYKKLFSFAVAAMVVSSMFKVFEISLLVPLLDRILNKQPIVVPNKLPAFLTHAITYLNSQSPETLLKVMPLVILVGMIVKHIFTYLYQYLMNDVAQRILRDVRQRLYEKIQSLSLDYFSEKRTGELMSRITHDVLVIENAVSYSITDLFVQTFTVIGFLVTAFMIHVKAALIVFLVFPVIIWPMTQIGRKLRKLARQSQERMADINSILLETISGIKVVKAFCTEKEEIDRFGKQNHEFYKLRMKAVKRLLVLPPITEIFGVLCGITIIFWLGRQVMDGQLSFGIFVLFFASMMSIISPIKKLGNVNAVTQQALAANDRIYLILDEQATVKEAPDAKDIPVIHDRISFDHVHFRYEKQGDEVLKDIDLDIKVGELVAIVGPTGTGKSTLANLIPRFYDPFQGRVTIDGMDVRAATFQSLRLQIGIVSQDTFLFNDTVYNNIAYGTRSASKPEVEEAARKAYAHSFIMELPKQYQTIVGDRGFRLSGGEKQRLTIARAVLKNPAILILDEATSQLDSESEKFVQEALDLLMQGRTVIAIAHRLSTIKKADKIVVLKNGRIEGMGKHSELLNTSELYKRLYETSGFQV